MRISWQRSILFQGSTIFYWKKLHLYLVGAEMPLCSSNKQMEFKCQQATENKGGTDSMFKAWRLHSLTHSWS
jgi:hypothetical protein